MRNPFGIYVVGALSLLNHCISLAQVHNETSAYLYDANGNVTETRDQLNNVMTHAYDKLNRRISTTVGASELTTFGYDPSDRLVVVTDPRELATRYIKNGFGYDVTIQNPGSPNVVQTFDVGGNLLTSTDAKGQKTTFEYDLLQRPIKITYSDLKTVIYEYDKGPNGIGRLSRIEDSHVRILYSYDIYGNVISDEHRIGGVTHITSYAYDDAGQLSSIHYPSGRIVSYTRANDGQIVAITTNKGGEPIAIVSNVVYEPNGKIRSFLYGNNELYQRRYDLAERVVAFSLKGRENEIAYDGGGRIVAISEVGNSPKLSTYGYDGINRVTSYSHETTSYVYNYDSVGNRTRKFSGGSDITYNIAPDSNRLAKIVTPQVFTVVSDANGSITSDGRRSYSYNSIGRMSSANAGYGATDYKINGLGLRVEKATAGVVTTFHYDLEGKVIAELKNGVYVEYIYLNGIPVAVLK